MARPANDIDTPIAAPPAPRPFRVTDAARRIAIFRAYRVADAAARLALRHGNLIAATRFRREADRLLTASRS